MGNMTITLPDDMQEALRQASKIEDRVIASIIRRAISEYLQKHHDMKVEHTMTWGGNRRGSDSDKED
jgi:predicted DNA-binding protein